MKTVDRTTLVIGTLILLIGNIGSATAMSREEAIAACRSIYVAALLHASPDQVRACVRERMQSKNQK
jgi:hypothetical protein